MGYTRPTDRRDQRRPPEWPERADSRSGSAGSTIEYLDITDFQDPATRRAPGLISSPMTTSCKSNYLGPDLTGKSAGPGNTQGDLYGDSHLGRFLEHHRRVSGRCGQPALREPQGRTDDHEWCPSRECNLVIGNDIGTDMSGTAAPRKSERWNRTVCLEQHNRRHDFRKAQCDFRQQRLGDQYRGQSLYELFGSRIRQPISEGN